MGHSVTGKRMLRIASCCSFAASYHPQPATFIANHRYVCRRRKTFVPPSSLIASSGSNKKRRNLSLEPTIPLVELGKRRDSRSISQGNSMRVKTENTITILDDVTHFAGEYDEQQFSVFESAIEDIVSKRNVMRDFRKNEKDLTAVKKHLLDKRRKLPKWSIHQFLPPKDNTVNYNSDESCINTEEDAAATYTKKKIRERCQTYLDCTGLTPAQHKLATVLLAHLADHCAKNSSPSPLRVAWEKILEAGFLPMSRTLSTYLYVLSLEDDSDASDRDFAAEVAMFHDVLYEPTEKTVSLLVKSLVGRGDASGAEALLDNIADGQFGHLRHRTTSPILKLYCEKGEIDSALRLYHKMRTTSRVKMDAATYADFISAVAKNGYFRSDSECIVGAEDLGFSLACGPKLLDALITEMAEEVLEISQESARALHNGFALGFKGSGLDFISDSVNMKLMMNLCRNGSLIADRVKVDKDTAKCVATDTTLRLIVLEQSQRSHVHDTLLEMAREKSFQYTAKLASNGRLNRDNVEKAELATQSLKGFSDWLDTREGKPYTAIVDGANVAYFGWGKINIHQLVHMVNVLENQGEHPLVIYPQKYTRRKFHLKQGMIQVLQDEELELLEGLKAKGQMYVVPPMCLDDLYWMLASVSNQTVSTTGQNIDVPRNSTQGRFPGLRPMVITNDKMRDHKMELLEERAFRRWCCSHIVNYKFTEYIENQWDEREISFHEADLFSNEIQGNVSPGCGEEGVMAWHFPVSEWGDNEKFCLRLMS